MKIFMIAGERSGDLHGSNLIKELKVLHPNIEVKCWGGDLMRSAGAELSVHYRELAFMGFWEVFKKLGTIRRLLNQCKSEILEFKPDKILLVDYPGFNLKIAQFADKQDIAVDYYIAPKAWAWNAKRSFKLKKYVKRVYSILPFEVDFFKAYGVNITYVGNPLIDAINSYDFDQVFQSKYSSTKCIAILPGSRFQEVQNALAVCESIIREYTDYQFLVAAVDNLPSQLYTTVSSLPNVELVYDKTYDVLKTASAAIVTSGTATLEAALLDCPQVVVYRTSPLTYAIAKRLIKIKFISLVNLIADGEVVKELIQDDFNPQKVGDELRRLISNKQTSEEGMPGYALVKERITERSASEVTAQFLLED